MTDVTRQAFADEAMQLQPATADAAIAGLDRLIAWTRRSQFQPHALLAGQQKTVAFGIGNLVFWRAYPGKGEPHKVTLIPKTFENLPTPLAAALAASLEAAVQAPGQKDRSSCPCHSPSSPTPSALSDSPCVWLPSQRLLKRSNRRLHDGAPIGDARP
jgi:hypothetical protein